MKNLNDLKAHLIKKQQGIIFESADDEGAAEYHGELQSIIEVIDSGADIKAVKEACEWVGETFPTELM